jgi:hypothetical protein
MSAGVQGFRKVFFKFQLCIFPANFAHGLYNYRDKFHQMAVGINDGMRDLAS